MSDYSYAKTEIATAQGVGIGNDPNTQAQSDSDAASMQQHYNTVVQQPSSQLAHMQVEIEARLQQSVERRDVLEATYNLRREKMQEHINAQVKAYNESISRLEAELERLNSARSDYLRRSHELVQNLMDKYHSEDATEKTITEALRTSLSVLRQPVNVQRS